MLSKLVKKKKKDSHFSSRIFRPLIKFLSTYELLLYRFEKTKETSPCAQCGLKACICCFYCLEKFIRYMNHNAYTVVAIEGTHFCNAARIVRFSIKDFIFIKSRK